MLSIVIAGLLALAHCAPTTGVHAPLERREELPHPYNPKSVLVANNKTIHTFVKTVKNPSQILGKLPKPDVCYWTGVMCDNFEHTNGTSVAAILWNDFELKGDLKLGGFVDELTDLRDLRLGNNSFKGSIPSLSKLRNLVVIDFNHNQLSGTFPSSILTLPLQFLSLEYNNLHGEIRKEVFEFEELTVLSLNNNHFSGAIPRTIGGYRGLGLYLNANQLTGRLPSEIAHANKLAQIDISENKLSGEIPHGLGNLEKLSFFNAYDNQLTGVVPEDLCARMKEKGSLDLQKNKFNKPLGKNCQAAKNAGILLL